MNAKFLYLGLAVFLLTGCLDRKELLQKFIPKDQDTLARHFIDLVRTGDYDAVQKMLASNLRGDEAAKALVLIHDRLVHGEALEIKTIGCNVSDNFVSSQTTRRFNLSYQIHFKNSWVLGNLVIDRTSSGSEVMGFHFYPSRDSLENINHFTLRGKSPMHFMVLGLCVLIPSFMLYSLVVCARSPIRRKWLWIVFILFGFVQFHFNWATGYAEVQPISISLLGVSAFSSGIYGPWILTWSLPVGALAFLLRRRKLIKPPVRESC